MLEQKDLDQILQEAIEQIEDVGIDLKKEKISPQVRISKATSYFGQCKRQGDEFLISISKYHLSNPRQAILETMIHEVLHTVEGCFNHGNRWKAVVGRVNRRYGYSIARVGSMNSEVQLDTPVSATKYVIVCKSCGFEYKRSRKSKLTENPERYRCSKCRGKLELK